MNKPFNLLALRSLLFALILLVNCTLLIVNCNAQKYVTKNGTVKFYSHASIEDIEAVNNQVNSALDASNGNFVFKVLMKGFEFKKDLMQEHFNENYVESDKYPDSVFKGKVINLADVNFTKDGVYKVNVEGDLTMHGVTQKVKANGTFEVKSGKVNAKSMFNLKVTDYDIKIPNTVANHVAEVLQITVDEVLTKL